MGGIVEAIIAGFVAASAPAAATTATAATATAATAATATAATAATVATGMTLGTKLLIGSSLLSGAMAYGQTKTRQKMIASQQAQASRAAFVQSRMDVGESMASTSTLGVSAASGSVRDFLSAQRSATASDLNALFQKQAYEAQYAKFSKAKTFFDVSTRIGSLLSDTSLMKIKEG